MAIAGSVDGMVQSTIWLEDSDISCLGAFVQVELTDQIVADYNS